MSIKNRITNEGLLMALTASPAPNIQWLSSISGVPVSRLQNFKRGRVKRLTAVELLSIYEGLQRFGTD